MTTKPPLVPGSFLLGSAADLRADMLGAMERAFREHGDVVRFSLGAAGLNRELFCVFHPDGIHRVLAGNASNYRKDNVFYAEIRDAFGNGLLTSQDEDWQRQKRFLQPLFTHRRVAGYAEAMAAQVENMVRQWRSEHVAVHELHYAMTRLTLKTVCQVLFGNDVEHALPVVQRSFGPLGEAVRRRAMAPVRLPLGWPTHTNRQLSRARRELFAVCDDIITDRRTRQSAAHASAQDVHA